MIKTVKVKKSFRLDELIKYVRENHIGGAHYKEYFSDCKEYLLRINGYKLDYLLKDETIGFQNGKYPNMPLDTTFTIEVEEEITEYTVFGRLIEIDIDGGYWDHGHNISIDDVKDEDSLRFYALIDNKLELIWEDN